jgi:hypothetical protein
VLALLTMKETLVVHLSYIVHCILPWIAAHVETLHFESACLNASNLVRLQLTCGQYEHIDIVRVIYGYTKQPSNDDCQFSIYDCIQEGASQNILSCVNQQTCTINLTKNEILSSTVITRAVPACPDLNYVQVNYACLSNSKDICDRWKDEGPIIHLSHTFTNERQLYNRCHCKVRSSMANGQVLLHAREINRQYEPFRSLSLAKQSSRDCRQTTYVEIATDRAERKCMDMVPSPGSAMFGSGSHNFSLTYVKNDRLSELFFYFELKASPMKRGHHVQILCNWARRPTTTTMTTPILLGTTDVIDSTTTTHVIPIVRQRKSTTISMQRGGKLSRLDLIRHRTSTESIHEEEIDDDRTRTSAVDEADEEQEQEQEREEEEEAQSTMITTTTMIIKPTKVKRKKTVRSTTMTTTSTSSISTDDDEEWSRILALAALESHSPSKQLLSMNNRTFLTGTQTSINIREKSTGSSSTALLTIVSIMVCLTMIALLIYCLKVKRPDCLQRLKLNTNVAILFCCEAGKLLFSSSSSNRSTSHPCSSSTNTFRRHRSSSSVMPDYQSSEYDMNTTGNHGRTSQSIYDGGGKSIYSIDYDDNNDETEYTNKYDRHDETAGKC